MHKPARKQGRNTQLESIALAHDQACAFVGTAVMVHPDGTLYAQVQPSDVAEIIEQHIEKGNIVKRLALMSIGKL